MRLITLLAAVATLLAIPGTIFAQSVESGGSPSNESDEGLAVYEGRIIDLRDGWGEAKACLVWSRDALPECFSSEPLLLERLDELRESAETKEPAMQLSSSCSTSLRLYDGVGYSGSVLYLSTRSVWMDLSDYGWNNRTSSFKIGACSSYFADYANGGGDWYPTNQTQAWDVASSMNSGWNNDVTSVYMT